MWLNGLGDLFSDLDHVLFHHTSGSEGRGAKTESRRIPGLAGFTGYGIFVGDDADFFECESSILASPAA